MTWVKGGLAIGVLLYIHFAVEEIPFFSISGVLSEFLGAHHQTQAIVSNLLPRGCALIILCPMLVGLLLSMLFTLVILEESNWKPSIGMLTMIPVYLGGTWLLMMGATWMTSLMPMNSWASVWALPAMTPQEVPEPHAAHLPFASWTEFFAANARDDRRRRPQVQELRRMVLSGGDGVPWTKARHDAYPTMDVILVRRDERAALLSFLSLSLA